jgi:type II secretory pathway pseudopilin PulG
MRAARPRPAAAAGFTFVELLVLLAFIAAAVVLAAPVFRTARARATVRSTMADMVLWSEALTRYAADHGAAPSNPRGRLWFKRPILEELVPYFTVLRWNDWWGNPYSIWTGPGNAVYGLTTTEEADFLIASPGLEGLLDAWLYDPARPQAGLYGPDENGDFTLDIVFWNGRLIRGPGPERGR